MSSDPAASPGATGLTTDDLTDPALSATQLAQTLVGPGVTVTNAHFTGAAVAGGTFSGDASILGIGYGVVLSTGMVSSVIGPNNGNKASTDNGAPGDPALDSLAGGSTYDAASLDFDFVPQSKTVSFQYVFGSAEYNQFVYQFNDVFGFFINGTNCAIVPGTASPVSINTINGGNPYGSGNAANPQLYRNNSPPDGGGSINTELDGLTTPLTCVAAVQPGQVNHAHLSIADALDHYLDSDVFIKAGSLTNGVPSWVTPTPKDRSVFEMRGDQTITFTVKAQASGPPITISHSALPGGLTCADVSNPGNPAEEDCTYDPNGVALYGTPGFTTVKFDAKFADGTSAGTRSYVVGYGRYVAMGDSYAAGQGTSSYDSYSQGTACHRSTINAWAGQLDRSGAPQIPQAFDFVACGGAIIPDIVGGNATNDGHNQGAGPQIDSLDSSATLVTLSVGGNDSGFADVLKTCLLNAACRSQDAQVSKAIEGLRNPLRKAYAAVKQRAPRARIMVMGYPHAFSTNQENNLVNCYILAGDDLRWLNEKAKQLDGVIRDATSGSGVAEYIDVYNAFEGHGACDSDAWIHAVELGDVDSSFHPNDSGQEALFKIALKQLETGPPAPLETYTIYPSQTITATAPVTPGQDSVAFATDWPGSDVVMSLTSPSGRVITRTTQASDVDHQNGPTYEVYTVQTPEPGNWTVTLYGADVSADGETLHLRVDHTPYTNRPPIAAYTQSVTGTAATVSSPVVFDASGSYDTDGSVASYTWDFGDGTTVTGVSAMHAFTQTGVYTPLLTIVDNQGAVGYVGNGPITVTAPITAASISLQATEGVPFSGTVATFTDKDPQATVSRFSATIDWGDGTTSAGTPSANGDGSFDVIGGHTYAEEGAYPVTMTVKDAGGSPATAVSKAQVGDTPLVAKGETILSGSGTGFSGPVATFTDADPNGVPGDYTATINWGDGTASSGTISADSSGGFSVGGGHTYAALGSHMVQISIADIGGSTITATGSILSFAYLSRGSFTLGDQTIANATSNTTVTWWGSQWSKQNTLSGGAAPSAFKGSAASTSTTPPSCPGTWTAAPGNSSGPPSSVPTYMGVVVTSAITKSGGTISGDTVHIVVIKTDPGYAPDPGHPGTGTIVARVC